MPQTGKFTKIVATLGPASDSEEKIRKLYEAGVNVFRLNFSHGNHTYFRKLIKNIRKVSEKAGIMLDTKGPEVRTGMIKDGEIIIQDSQKIIFTNKQIEGDCNKVTINYKKLDNLKKGNRILIDDGLIEAEVLGKVKEGIKAKILNGGILGSRKTVSIQGHSVELPFLSKKDKEDLAFGAKQGVDFIAASFVRTKKDIAELRSFLAKKRSKAMIISKIEHWQAIDNIKDIVSASDGVMVARGDLGVEVNLQKVPQMQANIINLCNELGKPVIVATQMLESMKHNPRPTRAEISDVAHAIIQGADAIMLSGETAAGKYPVHAVKIMTKMAKEYDHQVDHRVYKTHYKELIRHNEIAIFVTQAAFHASKTLKTRAILAPTESGFTARMVARFKPKVYILAITRDKTIMRQLQISWAVMPMYEPKKYCNHDEMVNDLVFKSYKHKLIDKEDKIVITTGHKMAKGHTNQIEVYYVKDVLKKVKKRK